LSEMPSPARTSGQGCRHGVCELCHFAAGSHGRE
jgi:hypothetical protein